MRLYTGVNWQFCKNINDINNAIVTHNENWPGLTSANDIISITYDSNQGLYVVFWKYAMER